MKEACELMGVGPTQFANLRTLFLRFGIDGLQPMPVGRPRRVPEAVQEELNALRQQIADLEHENHVLKVQAEVAALRRQQVVRSKSRGAAAPRQAPPRADADGGAVP